MIKPLTIEEFYKNAKPTDLFKKVQEEILRKSAENPIDEYWVRYNKTWSALGHQVMGAEV
jgi:hypothetical protein